MLLICWITKTAYEEIQTWRYFWQIDAHDHSHIVWDRTKKYIYITLSKWLVRCERIGMCVSKYRAKYRRLSESHACKQWKLENGGHFWNLFVMYNVHSIFFLSISCMFWDGSRARESPCDTQFTHIRR